MRARTAAGSATVTFPMVEVSGTGLGAEEVVEVARFDAPVHLSPAARERMEQSAAVVARLAASEEPTYGVSTGFGSLANTHIPAERREELQRALVRPHAARRGEAGAEEVVRGMLRL